MFLVEYLLYFVLTLVFFGAVVLSFAVVPYQGVVSLMGVSFFCCVAMVVMGRTYAALVMYIVYLGGLVVVFGYCVSVEKGGEVVGICWFWFLVVFLGFGVVGGGLMLVLGGGGRGSVVFFWLEEGVWFEVNGSGVFFFWGGGGLVVCAWGLVVALFSVLVILSWTRLGGGRPF
uniref:NADH dehydrogenase subunit 6 n=1 Tax=Protobothrops cornutus TaxID=242842 RepID=U3M533_9SAUR|nr:NADH dehydrogenase subunit 6 [Protobothrops cornutus]AGS43710.1 NADH dehydrogenase subunit 6 [Protobothrops cornutus]